VPFGGRQVAGIPAGLYSRLENRENVAVMNIYCDDCAGKRKWLYLCGGFGILLHVVYLERSYKEIIRENDRFAQ
jgi:hypothetical protein